MAYQTRRESSGNLCMKLGHDQKLGQAIGYSKGITPVSHTEKKGIQTEYVIERGTVPFECVNADIPQDASVLSVVCNACWTSLGR